MRLPEPLIPGKLLQRYKRFLADIQLENGETVTAHCPNSGSMLGLMQPGSDVLLSKSDNPKRKLPFTWELVRVGKTWVGVNTANPNRVIHEALKNREIPQLRHYPEIKPEASWNRNCRFDFLLSRGEQQCFVEVKNVTLAHGQVASFPDAITQRGVKHLNELMEVVRQDKRGVMLYLVNREDCRFFKPAEEIDPVYARTLRDAYENGVEILVYRAKISPPEILVAGRLGFAV